MNLAKYFRKKSTKQVNNLSVIIIRKRIYSKTSFYKRKLIQATKGIYFPLKYIIPKRHLIRKLIQATKRIYFPIK